MRFLHNRRHPERSAKSSCDGYWTAHIKSAEHKEFAIAACLGESIVFQNKSSGVLRACNMAESTPTRWNIAAAEVVSPHEKRALHVGAPREGAASPRRLGGVRLRRVVHLEFDRMRGVLEADHLGHLQLDVAVDEVVVEHAAGLEEVAVLVEVRRAPRAASRTRSGSSSVPSAADRRGPCPSRRPDRACS